MEYRRLSIRGDAIVVVFDICSSSDVIEELTLCGDLRRYEQFLTSVKEHLAAAQVKLPFDPYKFTGDGWILLFPKDTDGQLLLAFLQELCRFFKTEFDKQIRRHLGTPPRLTGLTFGLEKGPLRPLTIYGNQEYFGRAINVACRLQTSIKDKDKSPAYKAIVSNGVFYKYLRRISGVKVVKVKRRLRNIRGGAAFDCKKIHLLNSTATSDRFAANGGSAIASPRG